MLPTSAHPIVNAFTASLKSRSDFGSGSNVGKVKGKGTSCSSGLQKVSQVLGWRNRFSQSEFYPIELCLPDTDTYTDTDEESSSLSSSSSSSSPPPSVVNFQVRQFQRGEVENTYGTGATVWPASLVLLKYLEHIVSTGRIDVKKQMTIGDLGSGTGITSIAAALLFPESIVICTDGCDPVVELAKENCSKMMANNKSKSLLWTSTSTSTCCANENKSVETHTENENGIYRIGDSSIRVSKYWWGDGTILEELEKVKGGNGKDDEGDAANNACSASFDILLISDCVLPKLYPIEPLIDALDECMAASTVAFLTFEYRYYPDYDPKTFFMNLASKRGFQVRQIPLEEQHEIYSVDDIEVWEIRRESKDEKPSLSL